MNGWQIVGFVASILSASTFLPEVIRAHYTRHLNDIAWGMLFLLVANSGLWIAYASYFQIMPVLLSACLNLGMGVALVKIKWQSERTVSKVLVVERNKPFR